MRLIENSLNDIAYTYLDSVYEKIQYFEYINYEKDMIIINAGVEEGFELPYFDFLTQNTCKIYNIDPSGFNNLSSVSKQVVNSSPNRFHVINKILWDQESDSINIPIDSNGTVLCQYYNNIHQMDTISFSATTVDEIVELNKLKKVDLIKMDIEGGEPYALKGAMKTISYFRPQLAISIYHLANHYWEIPLYLMKELENYKFYFGHYSPGRWEAILYAIPIEKL